MIEYDERAWNELERRQQSCAACRFLHEVQYNTLGGITAVVAATAEEQVSPHHPRCVYHRTAVEQSTVEKPTTHDPDGEVRGCSAGCTIGVSDISASRVLQPRNVPSGVSRIKKMHFQAGVLYEVRRNFVFF